MIDLKKVFQVAFVIFIIWILFHDRTKPPPTQTPEPSKQQTSPTSPPNQSKPKYVDPYEVKKPDVEQASLFFLVLNNKGLVSWGIDGQSMVYSVEPLLWKSSTHKDKEAFCNNALIILKQVFDQKGSVANYIVLDRTSGNKLAMGRLYGQEKITIYK